MKQSRSLLVINVGSEVKVRLASFDQYFKFNSLITLSATSSNSSYLIPEKGPDNLKIDFVVRRPN